MSEPKVYKVDLSFRGTVEADNEDNARILAINDASCVLECYDWEIKEVQP
jgi:hypothetical protein